jgi:TolB-like protein/Tfp pilus assembly protein PilF
VDDLGKTSLVGRKIAHYRISTVIGAGGMGEVYRATDTKLGRDVALKVLPADMAGDPDRLARFQREARAVAALNHPNVVTVYSVEEADNVHFITMELIEGQALDRLISTDGLPVDRIIDIANALAEALAAAHEKGILHRDLKPANVMVTSEGRVKVLDFGLAKDVSAENSTDATLTSAGRTQAGIVMGTPAYMSPEQVSGRALDHRTDIFSLGVMLYEMTTGRRPFVGTSSAELVSSILRDSPPSVTEVRPELPSDFGRVIRRCLEKDPRHRLQTARDVSNEFRDLARTGMHTTNHSTSAARTSVVADSGAARTDQGFWVAVLPFRYMGTSNADLAALAEGLTDDIVTNMSKFSYLRVIARGSTAQYAQRAADVRTAAKELGARFVMEGSIRQAGGKVRISVQLVDASTGAGLWAETYDRPFSPEATLDILDDVTPRIVATVSDAQGILPHSMTESLRNRDPQSLTPYEALLRSFGFHQHVSASEHLAGITALERAVKRDAAHADCWAMLSWLYRAEYTHGYNPRPDAMNRSLEAARRAVSLEPSSQLAHAALASAHFFRHELGSFRVAAERAIALNRMQGYTTAFMGLHFAYSGDWERGTALCEHATQLNPNHPGWFWLPLAINAYRQHDGERALQFALRVNMPDLWTAQVALCVIHCQLGHVDLARSALRDLLVLRPDFTAVAQQELEKWWLPEMVEMMLGDLRFAGLSVSGANTAASLSSGTVQAKTASGATRADEGFWVAALPFKYNGSNSDLKALTDGLSEEVTTGLSRFSYLRVIARGSTAKYSSESGDVRAIGKELGARYVMEGSLRQAGSKLRLAVQLADTVSGAHLWAETYERAFNSEAIFELQDELVPRIVATVADQYGVLPHSMSEVLRQRKNARFTPHEAVLRAFGYIERLTPEEHAEVRQILEKAVAEAPGQSDCWAMLSNLYWHEHALGLNPLPDSLARAQAAARRAVEAGPSNHLGHNVSAACLFFQKDILGFRREADRCMELNPMDSSTIAFMGILLAYSGEWDRGCAIVEHACAMNPNHPGWYHFAPFLNAYRRGDYTSALQVASKIDMPGYPLSFCARAAALGQLGEVDDAKAQLRQLRTLRPNFGTTVRQEFSKWYSPELVEQWIEGLRKAGLDVPDADSKPTTSDTHRAQTPSGESRADEGFWVAVLPFKYTGGNHDLKEFAEGLSEEVITGLSRFSYLHVIARGSTTKYSSEAGDVRAIGKELGARYVMEASLRQAGSKLRLAVQLVEATAGSHLWAETFERAFTPDSIFELQDDLVPRIVARVADSHGVLPRTMSQAVRTKSLEELTPYEAVLRSLNYVERLNAEEHAIAREAAERAVQLAPNYSQAWAVLSQIYGGEYGHFLNPQPEPLERALKAAQRAVDLDPANAGAHCALAFTLFFRKELPAFRIEAEQAMELNPYAAGECAVLGLCLAYAGDWDRGCAVVERAMQINPRIPGWARFPAFYDAYRKRDYQHAIRIGLKFNLPNLSSAHAALAAAYAQIGDLPAAQKELQELHRLMPNTAHVLERIRRWHLPEMAEHLIDGLHRAGLEIPENRKPTSTGSIVVAPSIAVLPFANMSDDKEQDYFSDGLAEEIINLLAQIPALKVIARTSAFAFRGKEQDIRGIAETLGVSTVLEGSVRRSGSRIRVTAQLINAADGSHLWSERYDRELSDIFAVQDEISAAIAKALRVKLSREIAPQRYVPKIEAYEAYLKGRQQQVKVTPESLELARRYHQQAIGLDPAFGMAHIGLAFYWMTVAHFGQHSVNEGVSAARTEVQRALQIDPTLADGHALLGYLAALFDSDWAAAEKHFDFPMAKQASFELVRPMYGGFLYLRGNAEEAVRLAERAIEEDPLDVWAHMNLHAYLQAAGREDEAMEQLRRVVELDPNQVVALASMVMIHAEKGEIAQALRIARRAYAVGRWFPDTVGLLAALLRCNGEEEESRSIAKEFGTGDALGDARAHALFHLICGEIDQGADWVEKAIEQRDSSMRFYLGFVICKKLRASNRWPKIAKMVNLPA